MNAKRMFIAALVVMTMVLSACQVGSPKLSPADKLVSDASTQVAQTQAAQTATQTWNDAVGTATAMLASGSPDGPVEVKPSATAPAPSPTITAFPTSTAQPTAQVILHAGNGTPVGNLPTFSYLPGGESFGDTATDVVKPEGANGVCFRVWRATNLVNLPWTAVFCNWSASNLAPKQQWPHPTQLTVTGTGTIEFDLYRDLGASKSESPDPYDVANAQHSSLGLGWFTQGFNGTTCVNDVCQDLSGGGVFQMSFPRDMTGHYHIKITVNAGQVQFWQGERVTSTDNWPLP